MHSLKLRTAALLFVGSLASASPACADWTAYGGNPEHHFFTTDKIAGPLGVVWKHATNTYADRGGNKGGPLIAEGTVYFPSRARLYAVDEKTGELKWRMPEAAANDNQIPLITATPVIGPRAIYVPTSQGITAYNRIDGAEEWTLRTEGSVRSSPVLIGDSLYFGADDDYVRSVNANSGVVQWKSNERGKPTMLSDDPVGSPTYYAGVIYINSSDMRMWAVQAETGRILWSQRMAAPSLDISPVAFNGKIHMAAGTTIYQFRLRGGAFRAFALTKDVENDISTTPIFTDTGWYFGDRNGYFYGFLPTGKPMLDADGKQWKIKLEGKPLGTPIITPTAIYVATDKGFIHGIDTARGKLTWSYRTEAPKGIEPLFSYYAIRAPLAANNNRLFVLGDDGTLTCLAQDASDHEGPVLTTPKPSRGTVMNGSPPLYVSVYLWDEGTGINPDTIEVLLDGVPIEPSKEPYYERVSTPRKGWVYDPVKRTLHYQTPKAEEGQPDAPLPTGRHTVQVQAADWRGNLNSLEWSFVVDNSIPKNAVAVKPKRGQNTQGPGAGFPGGPGGYPGGAEGGMPGMGGPGMGGPGGQQGQNGQTFRGRFGGYQYNNRGGNNQGGRGGMGGMGGGFGGRGGGMGGGFGGRGGGMGGGRGGGRGGMGGGRGGFGGY